MLGMSEILIILIVFVLPMSIALLTWKSASRQGNPVRNEFVSREPADELRESLLTAASGLKGYSVSFLSENTIQFKREYNPSWTIMLAVIGAFVISIFVLLVLLYRETETCTVQLSIGDLENKIQIHGSATEELLQRLVAIVGKQSEEESCLLMSSPN